MYQTALTRLGTAAAETLVVGDRLETDILGAQNSGCRSALVLSGVTDERELANWTPAPDIVTSDLEDLIESFLTR